MKNAFSFEHFLLNKIVKFKRKKFYFVFVLFNILIFFLFFFTLKWLLPQKIHLIFLSFLSICATSFIFSYFAYLILKELQFFKRSRLISRKRLNNAIFKLKKAHSRDVELTNQLQKNIKKLNSEIDKKQQIEQELNEKASLLETYFDLSPDLIFRQNENGEFIWCNSSTLVLLNLSQEEFIGKMPNDIFSEQNAKKITESDKIALQYNAAVTNEIWLEKPNKELACFEIKKSPFFEKSIRNGLIGFGRDISEHKNYEALLEKSNREKTTFISTISHEIRTPLNAIIGLSRIILDSNLDKQQREYQETIHASAIILSVILNDIIELDRLEQRKIHIERKTIETKQFFKNLENFAKVIAKHKNIPISLEFNKNIPEFLQLDLARFNQILWNIIHNAVKFTPENGEIRLNTWYEKNHEMLYFCVADTGIGIPQKEISKIFNMYYQVKNTHIATGTGIGLAISKRIAELMGGDIEVSSQINKGSEFTVSVHAPMTNKEEIATRFESKPTISLHILLIEDIELNILVAKTVLEKLGHFVEVAKNGKETFEKFKPHKFDLLLIDIQLPDISGLEIAKKLHEKYKPEELPKLVAFTANTFRDKSEYLNVGIEKIIHKPLSIQAFNSLVNEFWPNKIESNEKTKTILEQNDMKEKETSVLDLESLTQYVELLSPAMFLESTKLFEDSMPNYVKNLEIFAEIYSRNPKDKDNISNLSKEAHKIKGAAGSICLKQIQTLAKNIEKFELASWDDNVIDWIDELKNSWKNHLEILRKEIKNM